MTVLSITLIFQTCNREVSHPKATQDPQNSWGIAEGSEDRRGIEDRRIGDRRGIGDRRIGDRRGIGDRRIGDRVLGIGDRRSGIGDRRSGIGDRLRIVGLFLG